MAGISVRGISVILVEIFLLVVWLSVTPAFPPLYKVSEVIDCLGVIIQRYHWDPPVVFKKNTLCLAKEESEFNMHFIFDEVKKDDIVFPIL